MNAGLFDVLVEMAVVQEMLLGMMDDRAGHDDFRDNLIVCCLLSCLKHSLNVFSASRIRGMDEGKQCKAG